MLKIKREVVTLPRWVQAWSADAQVLAEDQGGRFEWNVTAEGEMPGVPNLLRQLWFNLLTNGLKFSPEGGLIAMKVERTARGWRWELEDEGPGLPEVQLAHIFGRFVRYEQESEGKARRTGHGLGLAICRSIVELHDGRIHAENRTDRSGLRLVVELPAN
ncbi:MAG: ATP-binding protein [Candidatus Synoicihabitans palmerolidicus]|nr:ATP-binding protein [Candidatus Synoicihabitans palmerolidicus]